MKSIERERIIRTVLGTNLKFKIKGSLAILSPPTEILRGLYLDNSATPGAFYPEVFVLPLFRPTQEIYFNFGFRLQDSNGFTQWNVRSSNLSHDLNNSIERFAFPFWESAKSAFDFATMPHEPGDLRNMNNREGIALAWAKAGNISRAIKEMDALLAAVDHRVVWENVIADRIQSFKKLLVSNPTQAQKQLVEWELQTRKNLKLDGVV